MKHPISVVLIILVVWLASQSIGLLVVEHYASNELPTGVERPDTDPSGVFWYLLAGIGIGTVLILLLARFNQQRLWTVWFSLAIFLLSYIALSAFSSVPVSIAVSIIFVWLKLDQRLHWIPRNVPELFLYAGIAAVFVPLLNIPIALLILLAISIYDAFAVWQSKHMVKLATFQIESGRFAGFSMPSGRAPAKRPSANDRSAGNRSSAILGGGDFAFPLLYSGTVLLSIGWVGALGATIGGYFGLLALFMFSKEGRFYPAMPFLAAGLVIGSLAAFLV